MRNSLKKTKKKVNLLVTEKEEINAPGRTRTHNPVCLLHIGHGNRDTLPLSYRDDLKIKDSNETYKFQIDFL